MHVPLPQYFQPVAKSVPFVRRKLNHLRHPLSGCKTKKYDSDIILKFFWDVELCTLAPYVGTNVSEKNLVPYAVVAFGLLPSVVFLWSATSVSGPYIRPIFRIQWTLKME
jgi:hypothetical protein